MSLKNPRLSIDRVRLPLATALVGLFLAGCASKPTTEKTDAPGKITTVISDVPPIRNDVAIENAFLLTRGADQLIASHSLVARRPIGTNLIALMPKTGALTQFDAVSGEHLHDFGKLGDGKDDFKSPVLVKGQGREFFVLDTGTKTVHVWSQKLRLDHVGEVKVSLDGTPLAMTIGLNDQTGATRFYILTKKDNAWTLNFVDAAMSTTMTATETTIIGVVEAKKQLEIQSDANTAGLDFDFVDGDLYVSIGNELLVLDRHGEPRAGKAPIKLSNSAAGIGVMACSSGVQMGYVVVGLNTENGAKFQVYDRGTHAEAGSFTLSDVKTVGDLTWHVQPSSYFPNGAIYATANGNAVVGVSWENVAKELGLRSKCF